MRFAGLMFAVLVIQGCVLTDATLDLALAEGNVPTGPLSELPSSEFSVVRIVDARTDKARIGYKRNSYGMNMSEMFSEQPVEQVVQRAIEDTLRSNGHQLAQQGIRITGEVSKFWFESYIGVWDIEFVGTIECKLVFSDARGELYRNMYKGSFVNKTGWGADKARGVTMNGALASLAEEIAFDHELADTLSVALRKEE